MKMTPSSSSGSILRAPIGLRPLIGRLLIGTAIALGAAGLVPGVRAATTTFTGSGGDSNWSTSGNWTTAPGGGDDIVIDDVTGQSSLVLDGTHSIGSLSFGNSDTRTTAFTISGTTLTINGGLNADGNFTALGLTVNAPVATSTAQTWSVGGDVGSPTLDRGVKLVNPVSGTPIAFTLGGKLTKTGAGQLGFSGLTIGNGDIQVSGGSLKISAANATKTTLGGTGTLTVDNGAKLILSQGSSPSTSTFDISKAIRLEDGATVEVGGSQTFHANSKITSNITLATSSTTTINALNTSNFVFSGLFLGGDATSVFEKTGASTLTFSNTSATNQTLAKLKVSQGTLILNSSTSNGWRGDVEIAAGATLKNQLADQINNASAVTINGTWDMNLLRDIIDVISGTGSIINGGLANATNGLSLNATVSATYSGTFAGTFLATTGGYSGTQTFTNKVTTTNLYARSAAGTTGGITFSGNATASATTAYLGFTSGNNDGTLRVTDGATLTIGSGGVTQGTGNGVFALGGGSGTATVIHSASGTSTGNVMLTDGSGGSPVINTGTFTATYSGTVGGTGGLEKTGTGVLVLTANNSYAGTTTVSLGTLVVDGDHSGGAAYTIASGGTLAGDGLITTAGNAGVALEAGGKLSPGLSPGNFRFDLGTGTFDISAGVAAANTQALTFELGSSSDKISLVNSSSLLDIGSGVLEFDDFVFVDISGFAPGTYTLFDSGNTIVGSLGSSLTGTVGGYSATLQFANSSQDIVLNVVPEPSQTVLLVLAGVLLLGLRRRSLRTLAAAGSRRGA